ncbi:Tetratricopeptide TPR_2 repeat protein [Enhygromyxa salina]|uniref:Tetratricopeptide TPR_2 repeat protein n=1 Tax=Enhygromyxa salina TaxID=215803 RepID=A0A0C1ZEA0_9BACT|nr:tetratricopeptide repeat protein [Enhygromyxa salina]KIG15999.1 Tetratricopeptide TPR_2 repeat protein [Enhygromyxa salina]
MSEFRRRKAHERLRDARSRLARRDYAAASEAFAAGLRLDPSDRASWEQWAECLEQRGKLIEAGRVLVEALGHHPDDPGLQLALVHAQIETGQFAAAERLLAPLRSRWPDQRLPLAYLARVLRDIRAYPRLQALLEQALSGGFAGDAELDTLHDACVSWQQARAEPRPALASMRELLLTNYQVVLLGTGHDDGLTIPWYSTYLCSNYDVVATCARLLGFARTFDWCWSAVAAVDPAARVLALLLAEALEIDAIELPDPTLNTPSASAYPDPAQTLAVASFVEPGWGQAAHGGWALRCAERGNMFAFGALNYSAHTDPLPPILGLAAGERVCLPWWRLGEARIGFGRLGLIDDLPPEIDSRAPARVADDYRRPLAEFDLGPNFGIQLRYVHEQRALLHPGLRQRSELARILPNTAPRAGPKHEIPDALARDTAEFLRALGALERAPERIGEAEFLTLERRFVSAPEIRSRLSDLLYRVAPARFSKLLHQLVARPAAQVPWRERDGLLHLYGCNPWTKVGAGSDADAALASDPSPATTQLERWLELGAMTNRSEIVQSKYGLHHLAEATNFAEILARLLADEPAIVLGTVRWLHDNPHLHAHVPALLPLLDHPHADVVFEALQCTRVAKLALPATALEPILAGHRHPHPRMRSAAVEHLELWPITAAHPRLREHLLDDDPSVVWAAARALLRGGESLAERVAGAQIVAARILELGTPDTSEPTKQSTKQIRQLLRTLASANDYALIEPLLQASESPSLMKIIAAALTPTLIELDDPRLLPHLRSFHDAFGLDPPLGFASLLLRHGDPKLDRDAVHGAQGATDPRACYEAKAGLARWGDALARAELEAALGYASPTREAAFEAWFCVLHEADFALLDAALRERSPELSDRLWTVLCANVAGAHPAPRAWIDGLAAYLRDVWTREQAWAAFIEQQLRDQIPSKFVVGAQSATFTVLAKLLPKHLAELLDRCLDPAGIPDRLSVDALEWLGVHEPEQARAWANKLLGSPHWGVRQCARRLL